MKKKNILTWFIAASFLILLYWFSINNFTAISKPVKKFIQSHENIHSLSTDITDAMKSNELFHRDEFININGLYGRITGRRLYNKVVLLNNGMLTEVQEYMMDIGESTNALSEFQKFVNNRGLHFLYVQCPFTIDMSGELAPDGLEFKGPQDFESTLNTFKNVGVDVIDTLPELTQTPQKYEENFYRTDHHWKPYGAFKTFQIIMERISELFPEENFPHDIADIDQWTIHEIPDQFLGSRGKRVGKYFAGLDSLQWITPDFETDLSMYIPEKQLFVKGNYEDVFIRKEYMQKGLNVLHTPNYSIYIGKDYQLIQIRNSKAPSALKLLILKDSFARPLVTFLSMFFRELDIIDPRYYSGSSIKEYIDRTNPDLIIMASYSALGRNGGIFFRFEKANNKDRYLTGSNFLLSKENISIKHSNNNNNTDVIFESFENDKCYTLYIPEIKVTAGATDAVSVALYNKETQKVVKETMFDINYCSEFKNCRWTFETPKSGGENLQMLLYAGMRDNTENIGVICNDVQLFENEVRK